jgi:hypothetical protein
VKTEISRVEKQLEACSPFGKLRLETELKMLDRKYKLLGSTLDAMYDSMCVGRSHLYSCECPAEVTKIEDTCESCKSVLKYTMLKNNSKRRVLRSEMLGPVLCYCAACLKHRGIWNPEQYGCTCYYPHQDYPLDMCTTCLCMLASEQYIWFDPETLYDDERIKRELLNRSWRFSECIEGMTEEYEKHVKQKLIQEHHCIQAALFALLPDNAHEGCNSKGRFNACKCAAVVNTRADVCDHCKWLDAHLKGKSYCFPEDGDENAGTVFCQCLKCKPDRKLPNCTCKSHFKRQPSALCNLCLINLAREMKSGKRICFCFRKRGYSSCGAESCPNPVKHSKYCNRSKCEGAYCSWKINICLCWCDKLWMSKKCKPGCLAHKQKIANWYCRCKAVQQRLQMGNRIYTTNVAGKNYEL